MYATSAPNRLLAAPAGRIVKPRAAPAVAHPVSVAQVGPFRSRPAEIEGTALPPHFRPSTLGEFPVSPAGTGQALRPAAGPLDETSFATARHS
jgi:hypothetical protein